MPISRLCHHLYTEPAFIFEVKTTGAAEDFRLPLEASGSYNFQVVWGDGNVDNIAAWDAVAKIHTYASAGTYVVIIMGEITGWRFNSDIYRNLIYEVREWGPLRLGNSGHYFAACEHLTVIAGDMLDITGTTDFNSAFELCYLLTDIPCLNSLDMSNVTNLWETFSFSALFDQDLSSWDVSNVTCMYQTFSATAFNHDLNSWDVSKVTDMDSMFSDTTAFNKSLDLWDVSSVLSMDCMFCGAAAFNQSLDSWTVSNVTDMDYMFYNAPLFNKSLNSWDVSSVTSMVSMFFDAIAFNQSLDSWTVSAVTRMDDMFNGATAFNQDISGWTTTSLTRTDDMFNGATAFDQDLGGWDVTALTNADEMFKGVTLSTANYDALLIGWEGQAVLDNVTFGGGNSKYSAGAAATARQALIDDHSWVITDGGQV